MTFIALKQLKWFSALFHKTAEDGQPVFGCFYDFWGGITMI